MKWVKKPPHHNDNNVHFYWCRYEGKHGQVVCPCEVCTFEFYDSKLTSVPWVVRTTRGDSFNSNQPQDIEFGPEIPELEAV